MAFDWEIYDAEQKAEREKRDGYRGDYTGARCLHCARLRVMACRNGKLVCEKCGRDQRANEYTDYLSI